MTTFALALHTARHRAPEPYPVRIATPEQVVRVGRHAAAEDAEPAGDLLDRRGFTADAR